MSGRPVEKAASKAGETSRSSDGRLWESQKDSKGTWRWYLVDLPRKESQSSGKRTSGKRSALKRKRATSASKMSASKTKAAKKHRTGAASGAKRERKVGRRLANLPILLTRPEMTKAKKAFVSLFVDDYLPTSIRNSRERLFAEAAKRNVIGDRMVMFYEEGGTFPFFYVFAIDDESGDAIPLVHASPANFKPHLLDVGVARYSRTFRLPSFLAQKI